MSCDTRDECFLLPELEEVWTLMQTDPETALLKLQNFRNSESQKLSNLESQKPSDSATQKLSNSATYLLRNSSHPTKSNTFLLDKQNFVT